MLWTIVKGIGIAILVLIIAFYGYLSFLHIQILLYGPEANNDRQPLSLSISDGVVRVSHTSEFTLAGFTEDLPKATKSTPCLDGFLYCLYYSGNLTTNAWFDAAGFSFKKIGGGVTEEVCLAGFPVVRKKTYRANRGDAVSGETEQIRSTKQEYRVYTDATCYAFESRIAFKKTNVLTAEEEAQFALLQKGLERMAANITLRDGTKIVFPK